VSDYYLRFDGLFGACVKTDAATVLTCFGVDGLRSNCDAIVATLGEVDSLFLGLFAISFYLLWKFSTRLVFVWYG
jgi:hypothetical protein